MVSGDVMNTGARLQAAAPPGGVLVGEATYRATERVIDYAEARAGRGEGEGAAGAAWRAVAPRASFGVDIAGTGRAPLVGRERELDLLADALTRARETREPQLVTLVGVPGIGKSRLVHELFRIVERGRRSSSSGGRVGRCRTARASPSGRSARWSRRRRASSNRDDAEDSGTKLERAVGRARRRRRSSAAGSSGICGRSSGSSAARGRGGRARARRSPPGGGSSRRSPSEADRARVRGPALGRRRAARLRRRARRLGHAACRCSSSPPHDPSCSSGGRGGAAASATRSRSRCRRSSDEDTARLLADLLDRACFRPRRRRSCSARAGGNPLFAEEYVRMLAAGDGTSAGVPETLQALVAARIDGLAAGREGAPPGAAVLGKVFWTDALAALDGRAAGSCSTSAAAAGAEGVRPARAPLGRRGRRAVRLRARARTRRRLRADARAERAAASRRRRLDRVAAPDRSEDRAEMLAHHLSRALEYDRAGGRQPEGEVARRAARPRARRESAPWRLVPTLPPRGHFGPRSNSRRRRGAPAPVRPGPSRPTEEARTSWSAARRLLAAGEPAGAAEAEAELARFHRRRGTGASGHGAHRASARPRRRRPTLRGARRRARRRGASLRARRTGQEGYVLAEEAAQIAASLALDELRAGRCKSVALAKSLLGEPDGIAAMKSRWRLHSRSARSKRGVPTSTSRSTLIAWAADAAADARCTEGARVRGAFRARLAGTVAPGELPLDAYRLGDWQEALELAEHVIADEQRTPHYMEGAALAVRGPIRAARGDNKAPVADSPASVEMATGDRRATVARADAGRRLPTS